MLILLGNTSAKEAYRDEVTNSNYDELIALAQRSGVKTDDCENDANGVARLQERLSSVTKFRELPGPRITTIMVPSGTKLLEALATIVGANGVWSYHGSDAPDWVEGSDDAAMLVNVIAEHYGCPIGRPDDWEAS